MFSSEASLPTLDVSMRSKNEVEQYRPYLEQLTDAEMDKKIRDQDRNARYDAFVQWFSEKNLRFSSLDACDAWLKRIPLGRHRQVFVSFFPVKIVCFLDATCHEYFFHTTNSDIDERNG